MLEKDIERKLTARVKSLGGKAVKMRLTGTVGFPDRLCVMPGGKVIFVEVKRNPSLPLSPNQAKWRDILIERGCDWRRIDTAEGADNFKP